MSSTDQLHFSAVSKKVIALLGWLCLRRKTASLPSSHVTSSALAQRTPPSICRARNWVLLMASSWREC
eukprot:7382268-Prymnesium_polylepis.1